MTSELRELQEAASALVLHLPAAEIASRQSEIERVLGDYDFSIDVEFIAHANPVQLLLQHLMTFVETEKDDRIESEWFALLALYLLGKNSELHTSETYLHFIRHALNTATVSDERASVLEYRINQS